MSRLRYNGLTAVLGAALAAADTAVTFSTALSHSGGTAVPTIAAGDYIPLTILDASGNVSEIVHLTAYTAGATTGTILRAQESTTGVSHASGDKVIQSLTSGDMGLVACKVNRASSYTLAANTATYLPWDGEFYDTHTFHDNTTNPSRLTVPSGLGGLYTLSGSWGTDAALNTTRGLCRIAVNGVDVGGAEGYASSTFLNLAVTCEHVLAAGDYVELLCFSISSASLALPLTSLSIRRVSTDL